MGPSKDAAFEPKIHFLDRVDDALQRHDRAAIDALALSASAMAGCSDIARQRALLVIDTWDDCLASSAEPLERSIINVGTDLEALDASCGLTKLETSELFYRVGASSFKVTVRSVMVGSEVYLSGLHCHGRRRADKTQPVNCKGKWPFVTQIDDRPCPW